MKGFLILIALIIGFGFNSFAQEKGQGNSIAIPAESNETPENAIDSYYMPQAPKSISLGSFHIHFIELPQNISIDSKSNEPLDMLAIGEAEEMRKKSYTRKFEFPTRQLKGIRAQVQVSNSAQNPWGPTNNRLNFQDNTHDGPVQNESLRDIRQPFIDPYYSPYYYNNSLYRPSQRGFYFYRR